MARGSCGPRPDVVDSMKPSVENRHDAPSRPLLIVDFTFATDA
jgi:hypothetical protein